MVKWIKNFLWLLLGDFRGASPPRHMRLGDIITPANFLNQLHPFSDHHIPFSVLSFEHLSRLTGVKKSKVLHILIKVQVQLKHIFIFSVRVLLLTLSMLDRFPPHFLFWWPQRGSHEISLVGTQSNENLSELRLYECLYPCYGNFVHFLSLWIGEEKSPMLTESEIKT